ncbi:MAG: hypothetical protein LQ340_002854 [Diploschistes diacapsis]|nr:MAG: hypothetical protein LQ340_002854 [Diploschistes diacapsis]
MSVFAGGLTSNYDRTLENQGPVTPGLGRRPSQPGYMQQEELAHLELMRSASRAPASEKGIEDTSSGHSAEYSSTGKSREQNEAEVQQLARLYSQASTAGGHENPFQASKGSTVDPDSENFVARAWIKSMLKLRDASEQRVEERSAGVAFRDLSVHGYSAPTDYQKTVGNYFLEIAGVARRLAGQKGKRIDILRNFDGLVYAGELLVVLGPPGSGCSTFLKTIAGETHGFEVDPNSKVNYQGISYRQMHKDFRGEAIYTAEQDVHFPQLTVGETLLFAARARAPRLLPEGISPKRYAAHLRDVVMATFGIRHTINTKVGNDFVRGVSGGERKRVSIAEAALSGAPLQCWDNSTRGLDSANAVEFCKTLRTSTELANLTAAVAIYQAPQSAYDYFDKAIVLYEGRQIFFGRADEARAYFESLGFVCPERQTTADFLTSMTSPAERVVREDWEHQVPRTSEDFAERWRSSPQRARLLDDIARYEQEHPVGGPDLQKFQASRRQQQAARQRVTSPYTLSYVGQIKLCLWRGFRRLAADPSLTIVQILSNAINALIVGSLFYNQQQNTSSLSSRSALLFFAILLNAFASALEILVLYAQRPIVEKHTRYALYHPSAEAFASILTDLPSKILSAVAFNLVLYFLTNLRREPGAFFFFFLMSFVTTLVMSMFFRTIASVSRSLIQALVPTALVIIAIVVYTGFTIPVSYMQGWARWINYINPTAYGFEALMVNEFSGRDFPCSQFVPPAPYYGDGSKPNQVCASVGAVAGHTFVNGDAYINSNYQYYADHKWRNLGILIGFGVFLLSTYLIATESISAKKSKGEVLLFRRGHKPASLRDQRGDLEASSSAPGVDLEKTVHKQDVSAVIQKQTAIFQWKDVCYDIKIKSETRRILDHVDGWVKPGTMTALMGVSGAGKTTLLDVLATRTTMGVIGGEMLVDGRQRDESFQRKTGYVQQQDLHLQTSTVREALEFSALLRQPAKVPRQEKLAYVHEVIKLLEMEEYADAVVGVPGEGLNVEQRKRLTIGVELAAKPQLLLFLDEPTSGLDSQTSWSILDLLEKLTNNGQAILCTIHQPSATLFQRFDRLLFLAAGGKTVYFGPVGKNAASLSDYFQRNGASPCPPNANPAEWMLEVIGAAPGSHTEIDWFDVWRNSPELEEVHAELENMKIERPKQSDLSSNSSEPADYREFAAPLPSQLLEVLKRIFAQYWRTPSYIFSKLLLCSLTGLFIGFSFFRSTNTQQGLQDQLFGIFMLLTLFSQLVQQIMPLFVTQRSLYEARERPSKTYSWKAFMLANMLIEIPWSTLAGTVLFFTWYYPIGLFANAEPTGAVAERGALTFLLILAFLWFSSTFAHLMIAGVETAETASNIANLLFSLCLLFCGVLVGPQAMPGFWIFMYRVSPFTYLVEGLISTAVSGTAVTCAANEYLQFAPAPGGATCGEYMRQYIAEAGGYLLDEGSRGVCKFCPIGSTDTYLAAINIYFGHAWRDFGILIVYVVFNMGAAVAIYWLARVPKRSREERAAVREDRARRGDSRAVGKGKGKEEAEQSGVQ